ncbi:hypothetical protein METBISCDRAFT_24618 [Metschnikowia bicuspidata]|uniref:Uncharacterized protein n=1 Tax=Metschnikowia bicuspidata TaxID=27322 RepID=A0A4P9Z8J9_9ASCO|nr:hypothetical protein METBISCDRAFT_24618 [Metschnikowia bicuspidata]
MFCNKVSLWLGVPVNSAYSLELQVADSQAVAQRSQIVSQVAQVAQPSQASSQVVQRSAVSSQASRQPTQTVESSQLTPVCTQTMQVCTKMLRGHSESGQALESVREVESKQEPDTQIQAPALQIQRIQAADCGGSASFDVGPRLRSNYRNDYEQAAPAPQLSNDNVHVKTEPSDSFSHYENAYLSLLDQASAFEATNQTSVIDSTQSFLGLEHNQMHYDANQSGCSVENGAEKGDSGAGAALNEAPPTITENDIACALGRDRKSRKRCREKLDRAQDPLEDALMQTVHNIASLRTGSVLDLSDEQLCLQIARRLKSTSFKKLLRRVESVIVPSFETE